MDTVQAERHPIVTTRAQREAITRYQLRSIDRAKYVLRKVAHRHPIDWTHGFLEALVVAQMITSGEAKTIAEENINEREKRCAAEYEHETAMRAYLNSRPIGSRFD